MAREERGQEEVWVGVGAKIGAGKQVCGDEEVRQKVGGWCGGKRCEVKEGLKRCLACMDKNSAYLAKSIR